MVKGRLLQLGAIAAIALSFMTPGIAQAEPKVGDTVQLPDITLVDGTVVPASQFQGKPVIVEYWASWCPFCARQNPYWQKLHNAAKGKNIEILSVSIDKKPNDAVQYLHKHNYTFRAALETPQLRQVFGKRKVIPQVFVIKPDGKVAEVIPGEMFEEDVLDLIKYAP